MRTVRLLTQRPTPVRDILSRLLRRRGLSVDRFLVGGEPLDGEVLVPLGEWESEAFLPHIPNIRRKFHEIRGFVDPLPRDSFLLPTFDPLDVSHKHSRHTGVLLHDLERALEVARDGHVPSEGLLTLDPGLLGAERWAEPYLRAVHDGARPLLAYDIETPTKAAGADEGELEFDDPTYILLRIGFSWREGEALSLPWAPEYLALIRLLLGGEGTKLGWNLAYDRPRLEGNGYPVRGASWDMMWGWHILNSALEKGLAFVTPFYCPAQARWKHLSGTEEARYNAIDARVTREIASGVVRDLQKHRQWDVFERHAVMLDEPLRAMSAAGMPIDNAERLTQSALLDRDLTDLQRAMEAVVPLSARRFHDLTRAPEGPDPEGRLIESVTLDAPVPVCPGCGAHAPLKPHFKVYKKKLNACAGLVPVMVPGQVVRYRRYEPFVPSLVQMLSYQRSLNHAPVLTKDADKKPTFDDDALRSLGKRYPRDPLYPLVLDYREREKVLGTYVGRWDPGSGDDHGCWVGGLPVQGDGKVRTTYTSNPSTLRLSSQAPNLQNIPRDAEGLAGRVKALFIADPGHTLLEVDFSAIEAVLVGYAAAYPEYMRLSKMGIHDYVNAHILHRDRKVETLVDLSWSDHDLKAFFKDLKRRFKVERDISKRIVHLSNYGGTPQKIQGMHPELFPTIRSAALLQGLYWEVCPGVRRWQQQTVALADKQGFLRNPFDYVHRFWQVQTWSRRDGEWFPAWAEDAKAALAFLPQSTAAAIIKEALLRLWAHPDPRVRACLRLQVHDSLVCMIADQDWDEVAPVIWETMMEPIPQLPLPPEWGMGKCLQIGVEAKSGPRWRGMREVKL